MTFRAPHRRGFTLLELTLATSIVAIVALSLYSAMSIAFRARTSATAQTEAAREMSIALDIIAADFQSALPLPPAADGGEGEMSAYVPTLAGAFVGTSAAGGADGGRADTVRFHAFGRDADAADSPLGDGARFVELELSTETTPPVLVRRVNRNLRADGGSMLIDLAEEATEEPLLGGVRSFELRYHDGYAWLDDWDSFAHGDVLPLAVEITLELDAPAPRRPGEFYRATQVVPLALGRIADDVEVAQ